MSFSAVADVETEHDGITPAAISRLLFWVIVALTGALLLWSALAEVDEVASAQGHVISQRQLQIVSNLEGGVVKTILVRPGAKVTAGQALVELDGSQFTAEFGKTSESFNALAVRAARLQAEVAGGEPHFSAELATTAPQLVATERTLLAARRADLAAATGVESAKLDQARRVLGQAEVDAAMRAEAVKLADRELAMIKPLADKGIEPQIELIRAQNSRLSARGAAGTSAIAVLRARGAIAEAQSTLATVRDRYRSQAIEALAQSRADLAGQGKTLPALADRLTRTTVRSPVAGTVNRVLVATVGGSIKPGEPLVEVVPRGDALIVEAQVKPADIAFIHLGQRATVKLTAYDYSVYGSLAGVVEHISADAIVNERTGESHYAIRIRTRDAALKAQDGSALPIGPGMMAEVDVLGHKRSVLNYVLTPLTKLRDNAFREK